MKYILTYFTPSALRRSLGLQFVYCMAIIPPRERWWRFRWVVKVGVSDGVLQRRKDVQAGVRKYTGEALHVYVFPLPVFAPKPCEIAVHGVLNTAGLSRNPFPGTTGHTEWFLSFNFLFGFVVAWYAFADGMPFAAALGWWALVALLPVPFDAALLVLLVAAIHWGLLGVVLWGAGKMLMLCGAFG